MPTFNGGHFTDGIAALASLDGNDDGVINSQDQAFGDLVVWQDANHNGVSETGELAKLGDLGISSISLTTTSGGAPIDGQNIAGTGSFTYADGTTGTFVEVDLDASLGAAPAQPDSHPAEAHDLSAFAAVAAEIDHGGAASTSAHCISRVQITLRCSHRRAGSPSRWRMRARCPLQSRSCMSRLCLPCSWRPPSRLALK